ncbi:MAG: DUF1957 domain-containing protein [Candidatus Brocadiaceae bacterium]|jgi:1,4-alpha-glucan branching enzyme
MAEPESTGCFALVLHCHLPYVRHPEHEDFLEESWLYEAVAETYVPLLLVMERLLHEGIPFRFALSLSPTLCEMLSDELLQERCRRYLRRQVELAEREVRRKRGTAFEPAARMYLDHFSRVREAYAGRYRSRLLRAFSRLEERGNVELIGSAATHALFPLLSTPQGRAAQVEAGLQNFSKHFGHGPDGFWLPECAYEPGLEDLLARCGMRYFILDTHGILLGDPRPAFGVFRPLETPSGCFAFGRDVESSRQVWSADEGFPGDALYREFYRDLGYDAPLDYVGPYLHTEGERRYLGFKYHRVTGDVPLDRKEPYEPDAAFRLAERHAKSFVQQRAAQAVRVRQAVHVMPVIVAPYDAELFGHWWFEGPAFLEAVFRELARCPELTCVTPGEFLRTHAEEADGRQAGRPAPSSWGYRGYFETWVNGSNDWMYPRLHRAESRLVEAVTRASGDGLRRRALDQAARELMLAQGSDWAFLVSTDTAREYATRRFGQLTDRCETLIRAAETGGVDPHYLTLCEAMEDAFPELDCMVFGRR